MATQLRNKAVITLIKVLDFKAPFTGYRATDLKTYRVGFPLCCYAYRAHPEAARVTISLPYNGPFFWVSKEEYFTLLVRTGISTEEASKLSGFTKIVKPLFVQNSFTRSVKNVVLKSGTPILVSTRQCPNQEEQKQTQITMAKKSKVAIAPPVTTAIPPAPPAPAGSAPLPVMIPESVPVLPVTAPIPAAPAPAPAPTVPKEPTQNDVTRPGAGTTTRLVWETADSVTATAGRTATRQEVIAACTAQGVNVSTATTQFGKWAKFNGYIGAAAPGRVGKPEAQPATAELPPVPPVSAPVDTISESYQHGYSGYKAATAGETVVNPHAEGSAESLSFVRGWNQAHADMTAPVPVPVVAVS